MDKLPLHPLDETDLGLEVAGIAPPASDCPPPFVDATLPDPPGVFVAGAWTVSTSGGDPAEIPIVFDAAAQSVFVDWESAQTDPNQIYFEHTSSVDGSYCTVVEGNEVSAHLEIDPLNVAFSVSDPGNFIRFGLYLNQRRTNGAIFADETLGSETIADRTTGGTFSLDVAATAVNTPGAAVTGFPGWTWTDEVSVQFYVEPTLDAGGNVTLDALLKALSVTIA